MDQLHYLTATRALQMFRARSLSPVELMEAVIAQAEAVEPAINAFGVTLYEQALDNARAAERAYSRSGVEPRPLEGLPVGIKEETPVAGIRTTQGSLIYKDWIPNFTAACVERILDAGGIIHARTNAPEFSCVPYTHSRLWGITRNPWNPEFSPGGSSGGSAAALAAGSTTLATGSDIGGSIRIPAAACGVVGYKPPYGRVPEFAPFNLDHYCHEGPLARNVADCALLENVMAGQDGSDIATVPTTAIIPTTFDTIKGWRIAVSFDLGGFPVDPEVRANTVKAVETFRELGALVEEVELGWTVDQILKAAFIHFGVLFGPYLQEQIGSKEELATPYARAFVARVAAISKDDFVLGLGIEAEIWQRLNAVLEEYRVLICPTFAIPALEAGREYLADGPASWSQPAGWEKFLMTVPFNICSRCPVISIPAGFSSNGVPTGIQIVGRPFDDLSVFGAAASFELVRPWLDSASARPKLALGGRGSVVTHRG